MGKTPQKNDKKANAKALFMTGKFTQRQIAEIVGRTEQTITRWVNEEHWDVILESQTTTKDKRISKYQQYLSEIDEAIANRPEGQRFPTNGEIDRINKLESTIKKLQDRLSLGEIVSFTIDVLEFVRAVDVDKAKELDEIFNAYIKSKV